MSNLFERVGLTRRMTSLLTQDLERFHGFLDRHRGNVARILHPDLNPVNAHTLSEVNDAIDALRGLSPAALQKDVREYIDGSADEAFGIRHELQSARREIEELKRQVALISEHEERRTRETKALASTMAVVLEGFMVDLLGIKESNGKTRAFDFRGTCFFGEPSPVYVSRKTRIRETALDLNYIRPDGVLIRKEIKRSYPRLEVGAKPDKGLEDILAKAKSELGDVYQNEFREDWKTVGFFVGFSSEDIFTQKPKAAGKAGNSITFSELTIALRTLVKLDRELSEFTKLITVRCVTFEGAPRFVFQDTPFTTKPFEPLAPPW